ncbi:MAG: nucleotidyl transferase AbiEii/AbiGii toxin family protein [Prolixibacteraceae bacterium]|nr:nucleotidyl transferase AbiEii/AbiGii toxin family protein [Prolixibacteraceae bacterium]
MVDINKHKFLIVRILKDIYSDVELAGYLGFKGGTALMLFYGLPRFSVDLDFNLLDNQQDKIVFEKVRKILLKYGTIYDEALKFHGPLIVLNYGKGERKLKIEISNRQFGDKYEIKNYLGINIRVMVIQNMFAHKLCALLDRETITNRDVFDCWFLMDKQIPLNKTMIESRMKMAVPEYLQKCIDEISTLNKKRILQGMGELMDNELKQFVKTNLIDETISLLKIYKEFPILA